MCDILPSTSRNDGQLLTKTVSVNECECQDSNLLPNPNLINVSG